MWVFPIVLGLPTTTPAFVPAPPAPYDSYDPYDLYGPDVEGCGVLDELEEVEDEESMGPAWLCVCVGG